MYLPTILAFCDNVFTNSVGIFFAEPCGWTGGYDECRHVLEIEGLCNHPAPGENIILNMGGNSTPDWLHKTLWFLRDGSK